MDSLAININKYVAGGTITDDNYSTPTTHSLINAEIDTFLSSEIMYYSKSYVLAQQDLIVEEITTHRKTYAKLLPKKAVEKLIKSLPNNINPYVLAELVQFITVEWDKNFALKK